MKKPPFHFVPLPRSRSSAKPRASGRTMMVDDGLPLAYAGDLVALAGNYIDLAKIKTGTARFYPREQLVRKLRLYKKNRIQPFLGGQFHEYVFATQGEKALRCLAAAHAHLTKGYLNDAAVRLADDAACHL